MRLKLALGIPKGDITPGSARRSECLLALEFWLGMSHHHHVAMAFRSEHVA